ncbi:MAG: MBL fold metallo-hydrolase [Actinomycetales bacterium]|nr:MBL fold metallo-hydrolase [Actinomycetales bacterium]
MEILPGIHRIEAPLGNRYIAMYLIEGDQGSALVDTGLNESVMETLLPYLSNIDHPLDRIRYVVNTHADFDHVGGNSAIRDACPDAVLLCGVDDRSQIEDIELMIDERYGEFRPHGFDEAPETKDFIRQVAHTVPMDGVRGSGDVIDLGSRQLEVLELPGHSRGHVGVYLPNERAAFIGDAVLWDSVLTATGEPAFPPTYRDVAPYRATIRQAQELSPDHLLTAHYEVKSREAIQDFLQGSSLYTDTVETVVLDILDGSSSSLTLLEIIERGHARLGPWGLDAAQYLVYPVLGHLEDLCARALVKEDVHANPPRYGVAR